MKKIVSFIVVLSLVSVSVFCQEDTSLRNLLNIDVEISGYGTVNSLSPTFGTVSYTTEKSWTPYLGFTKISEPHFFSIAGYDAEAEQAKKYAGTTNLLGWGGLIGLVIGSIGLGIVDSRLHNDDNYQTAETDAIAPFSLIVGSLITMVVGLSRGNWATAGQAQLVADEYNSKLKTTNN